LDPILKEIKLRLEISSDLYYRDRGSKEIVVVPPREMQSFITVANAVEKKIIYLSNAEVRLKHGTKVRINGGIFAGVEGIFMRIKGEQRVVVSLPNLFSVATAFVPLEFILTLE
jgi:transcription antitermination factor NusG